MRVVFMGTPSFAVPSLELLAKHHDVVAVLTRPDAVRSRGKKLIFSAVKEKARELSLSVIETTRITDDVFATLEDLKPDCIAVAAFGCILPDRVLNLAPLGCVNVHASLLPGYRGAAPIQRALMAGVKEIGVSIMKVVKELDAGDYCLQASFEPKDDSCEVVMQKLADLGAKLLIDALKSMQDGSVVWTAQDESQVSFAPKVTKDEMAAAPSWNAQKLTHYVQSSLDAAPVRIKLNGKPLRLLKVALSDESLASGEVKVTKKQLFLGVADGAVEVLELKPDGKREMEAASYVAGLHGDGLTWSTIHE